MKRTIVILLFMLISVFTTQAFAGEADIVDAVAYKDRNNTWRFDVTVAHADAGWEHYADRWEVMGPDGTVLATRVIYHPHVTEQPFTRSLENVHVPDDVKVVRLRVRDSIHGYGGKEFEIELRR